MASKVAGALMAGFALIVIGVKSCLRHPGTDEMACRQACRSAEHTRVEIPPEALHERPIDMEPKVPTDDKPPINEHSDGDPPKGETNPEERPAGPGFITHTEGTTTILKINDYSYKVDGNISDKEIYQLQDAGAKFIFNDKLEDEAKSIEKFRLIYVISTDPGINKDLFEVTDEVAADIASYGNRINDNQYVWNVDNESQFRSALSQCREKNETPILVYHNKEDGKIFSSSLSELGIEHAITCNNYKNVNDTYFNTTDFIDLFTLFKLTLKNYNQDNLFDFFQMFSSDYCRILERDKNIKATVYVTLGIGGGVGSVYIAVYYHNKNKDANG